MVEEEARVWYADWNERVAEVARRGTPPSTRGTWS